MLPINFCFVSFILGMYISHFHIPIYNTGQTNGILHFIGMKEGGGRGECVEFHLLLAGIAGQATKMWTLLFHCDWDSSQHLLIILVILLWRCA